MLNKNEIFEYIKFSQLSDFEKKFLFEYIAKEYDNIDFLEKTNIKGLFKDLVKLNDYYKESADTSIVKERINEELDLMNKIIEKDFDLTEDELIDLSYDLDKMYYISDLPFRKNDSIMKKILMDNEISRNKGGK